MDKIVSLNIENEEIVFADLTNRENLEVVAVCKSGNIFWVDLEKSSNTFLRKLPFDSVPNLIEDFNPLELLNNLSPTELAKIVENQPLETESIESLTEKSQGFVDTLTLSAKLYSFKDYICIVQERGTSGVVLNLSNPDFYKKLERGDYCVDQCSFPIAFYERNNQTFLIHGTDWNRLDITCLETDELLTDRIIDYDSDSNYFDYFHTLLSVSPDGKHFTSNGWIWHPYGQITLYSIDEFLRNFELSHKNIELTEDCYDLDWNRPLCWIDEKTLAIGFSKNAEEESEKIYKDEILFIDITQNKIINRIDFDGFGNNFFYGDVFGELFYDKENSRIICLNDRKGLSIIKINGEKIFEDSSFTSDKFSPIHNLFYQIDCKYQKIKFTKVN